MHSNETTDFALGLAFLTQARERLAASHELLRHCVTQLSDEQIWWRPGESQNSIGNLLLHVSGNLHERIVSLLGGEVSRRNRPKEFARREIIPRDELLEGLQKVVSRCDEILSQWPPERLLEQRSYQGLNRRFDLEVLSLIMQTLLHLAGHAQEVIFMTRLMMGDAYKFANPVAH
jgi:hypothetical protein